MGHYDSFYEHTAFVTLHGTKEHEKPIATDLLKQAEEKGVVVPEEMLHFIKVMLKGAEKYEPNNWLQHNGTNANHKAMHDSMFHHLAESWANTGRDKDSGLDPLLHLATRALMYYTRKQRGLV